MVIASKEDALAAIDLIVECYDHDPESVMELRQALFASGVYWLKEEKVQHPWTGTAGAVK